MGYTYAYDHLFAEANAWITGSIPKHQPHRAMRVAQYLGFMDGKLLGDPDESWVSFRDLQHAWEDYLGPIPEAERGDLLHAYYKRLTGDDAEARRRAAIAWSVWEGRTSCLLPNESLIAKNGEDEYALAFARIECHYFVNRGFFQRDDELLVNAHRIHHIPGVIVQGRYDVVCPAESAWALHKAWPQAKLALIGDAGHAALEAGTLDALIRATDAFR